MIRAFLALSVFQKLFSSIFIALKEIATNETATKKVFLKPFVPISQIGRLVLFLGFIPIITACQQEAEPKINLDLGTILGGQNIQGYERAYKIRQFKFPEDHASHPGFRNEWWYLTGNVSAQSGKKFGYQVTFFRTAIKPSSKNENQFDTSDVDKTLISNWVVSDVWMAHAAITDINNKKHYKAQLFSRANPGLAGAKLSPLKVWLEDWSLTSESNGFPWRLSVTTKDFELELDLTALKDPVLQGNNGLSQKSRSPGNASYYYSYTRMETKGKLHINNQTTIIEGLSWFDREWSTSALEQNQTGWNWFSLQFSNGEELMYYQLLDKDLQSGPYSQGKWIDNAGNGMKITQSDIELKVLQTWKAEDGHDYPTRWKIEYKNHNKSWIVQAVLDDQFMNLAVSYWEGAVVIYDASTQQEIGRGYLEMTRTK